MSALKIGNVLRAGLMAWAMFMDLNVRSGDNYVNIGQSLVGTSGAVALAALVCLLALSWADERLPKAGLRVRLAALFLGIWQVIAVSVVNTNDLNQPFLSGSQKLKAAVLALGIAHSQQAMQAERAVTDATNELLKKNAATLKQGTIEIAKESERGIVDIETLQQTNKQLIETLDELNKIRADGKAKRANAEQELGRIEGELRQKMLEINN